MRRVSTRTAVLAMMAALALVAAGCGGSSKKSTGNAGGVVKGAKKGGTVTVLSAGDFIDTDPGRAYYQFDYMLMRATQRALYYFKPGDGTTPTPDVADGQPQVSSDGKTVTIKIKSGIKFSPPVNRDVTAKDVVYAIQRGFTPSVDNSYDPVYMASVVGLKAFQSGKAKTIAGLTAPDDHTVVFKLDKPQGSALAQSLVLPASAPVPEEYAKKYDAKNPSTYKAHMVFTGPYMIENDGKGNITGYKPGKSMVLVRNPNWDPKTDVRPAYLDKIDIKEGNDVAVADKQILHGSHLLEGDFSPVPTDLKRFFQTAKSQLNVLSNQAIRWVALNTQKKPFSNINLRKAALAVWDRNAMRAARGGPLIGDIATHIIPPGMVGFDQAGGTGNLGLDFDSYPSGNLAVAQKYMKLAGFASGKYSGPPITEISVNTGVGKAVGEVAQAQLQKLGFTVKLRELTPDTFYSKFCQVPKSGYDVCPAAAWGKDFWDAQTVLDPTFSGKSIIQEGNNNISQWNDPQTNALIAKAENTVDPTARGNAWAAVDKLIMQKAGTIPWLWDKQANIASSDVNAVLNNFDVNWDLSFSSLK
jgi:peptide/nickel transport system substrate-binding protein